MQTSVGILSLIGFLTIAAIDFSFCNGNHDVVVMCREGEKQTLLQFKKDLEDPTNGLSSWEVEDDCCKWEGVVCDNFTGHVLELNLRNSYTDGTVDHVYQRYDKFRLNGKINPCLQKLKHLKYLDLSENNFTNIPFPPVIASMTQLQYINLSNAGFVGTIPHQLGNLSSLRSLGLESSMNVENLQWLAGLSRLEHLDLSGVNLVKVPNWLQVINNLPFLVELRLVGCKLDHFPPFLSAINFTSLAVLDLSGNNFGSPIPGWVFSLGSLVYLGLSSCNLIGPIPQGSWNLTSLETLDVSYNQNLNSSLPNSLFSTTNSLVYLSLAQCGFQGPFPSIVPNMTNLSHLDLAYNSLNSTIPSWLYSFSRLEFLDLDSNRLEGGISNEIGNLTSAIFLRLSRNNIEGRLPNSIGNLASLDSLDLSYNGLEGRLPNSIGNLASLEFLELSYNGLEESLPRSLGNLCNLRHIGDSEGVGSEVDWFYLSMAFGFAVKVEK
ncbi:Receptor-like protein EIX2 [Camellia lanceoleosa]|uniref:Receptor-like protein EIX2 n=1 Tax=Camellia lanceoleosa TaxID=1840588 RepID=A0ACC0HF71_9ERIC|nr:Receptor-like protein EIX2 [Camellia lanceoleosa]